MSTYDIKLLSLLNPILPSYLGSYLSTKCTTSTYDIKIIIDLTQLKHEVGRSTIKGLCTVLHTWVYDYITYSGYRVIEQLICFLRTMVLRSIVVCEQLVFDQKFSNNSRAINCFTMHKKKIQ